MNPQEIIKLAYAISFVNTLQEMNISPDRFVKVAAQSQDPTEQQIAQTLIWAAQVKQANSAGVEKIAAFVKEASIRGTPAHMLKNVGEVVSDATGGGDEAMAALLKQLPGMGRGKSLAAPPISANQALAAQIGGAGLGAGALGAGGYGVYEATREPTLMERLGLG